MLFRFLLFFGVIVLFNAPTSFGQILYTDIVPDTVLCTPPGPGGHTNYYIDMNHDGIFDFQMTHFYAKVDWVSAEAYSYSDGIHANYPCKILTNVYNHGMAFSVGDTIGPNTQGTWYNGLEFGGMTSVYLSNYNETYYPWHDAADKYLAVTMEDAQHTYYGWVCMDVGPNSAWLKVKAFAMNFAPDSYITAGQWTTTGIDQAGSIDGTISVYQAPGYIMVRTNEVSEREQTIAVYSVLGERVASVTQTGAVTAIPSRGLPKGMYLVTATTGETIRYGKVLLR